jgi:flagellin-like protein
MKNFKNFRKNCKAISPIFATLILIAIAVIAGVVVYMFTSGTLATMTGGGTAGTEKVQIQAAQSTAVTTSAGVKTSILTIYAQSSTGPVPIPNIIIKNGAGAICGTGAQIQNPGPSPSPTATPIGTSLTVVTSLITWTVDPVSGGSYTATLVSTAGGNFISPAFIMP